MSMHAPLHQFPALRRLPLAAQLALEPLLERRQFGAGDLLCRRGEAPAGLFAIESGEVEVVRDVEGRRHRREIGPGALVGTSALIDRAPPMEVRARRPTSVRLLPRAAYAQACSIAPGLAALVEERARLHELEGLILAALRRSSVTRRLSPRFHEALVEFAQLRRFAAQETVVERRQPAEAFFIVAEGKASALVDVDGDGKPDVVQRLERGDCFGEFDTLTGRPHGAALAARTALELVRFDRQAVIDLAAHSSRFARELRSVSIEGQSLATTLDGAAERAVAVLFLADPGIALGPIIARLAETVTADFGESVVPLRLHAGQALPADGPDRLALRSPFTPEELNATLGGQAPDFIFFDGSALGDAAPVAALAQKIVFVTATPLEARLPPELRGDRVLYAVPIGLLGERREQLFTDGGFPAGTVRLALDLPRLATRHGLAELSIGERSTFSRFARALTDRSVGVALGGGGAYGYAHVALLRELARAGVPIDLISGSSFGALVGAYYATLGEAGLEMVIERRGRFGVMLALAMISSGSIARQIDRDLRGQRLEELELAFFAVATEMNTGTRKAISSGPVGQAVRASGSFPGAFSPTIIRGVRYVDGGIASNVPDGVLLQEGADLVIASSVVPPPTPIEGRGGRNAVTRWLREVEPIGRLQDIVRSVFILLHTAGNSESESAHAVFTTGPNDYQLWSFADAERIVADSTTAVQPTIERAAALWTRLKARRQGERSE